MKTDAMRITVQINSTVSAESVDIALRDMSGEKYRDLVESELPEDEIEKRLNEIVKLGKSQKSSYGNMSHLIFAHIYVILIDCTNDDWESKQNYVADVIQNIYKFKKTINETLHNKFHAPIALIFTKYDTLPTEKQLPIDELFKKLPVIQNALTKYHAHDMFKYFKSNVSSRKLTNEEATERIQDHIANNPLNEIVKLNFKVQLKSIWKACHIIIFKHYLSDFKINFIVQMIIEYTTNIVWRCDLEFFLLLLH